MIIYGWKRYAQVLAVLTLVCQQCHLPAEHVLRRLTTKVTLFFIPLFPISRRHTLTCGACQGENKVSREQAEQLMAGGVQQSPTPQPQPQQQFAGPPQPGAGQPRYQPGPPPQQPMRPPMPAPPGPYGGQPPHGYQQGPPPGQRPHPGQHQPAAYPPPGFPQRNGGHPYPPGR